MAQFIGKNVLEEKVSTKGLSNNVIKGLKGELQVGILLAKYLPSNTYVIAHPAIGKYDPDFLIISPEYGFRLVEVKNWNIENIREINSNGAIKINNSLQNPFKQVKNHAEEFSGYIHSLRIPALKDPYRTIGHAVIYLGFTREQLYPKMANWGSANKDDFLKFHIFVDQLGDDLNLLLRKANKFNAENYHRIFTDQVLKQILNNITVSTDITSDEVQELNTKLKEFDSKLSSVETKIRNLQQSSEQKRFEQFSMPESPPKIKKNKHGFYISILILVTIISLGSFFMYQRNMEGSEDNFYYENVNHLIDQSEPGSYVELQAQLVKFTFDQKSGTKFLILSDGENTIDGVVFKGKEIPYLNEGDTYVFKGKVNDYEGNTEIVVDNVE